MWKSTDGYAPLLVENVRFFRTSIIHYDLQHSILIFYSTFFYFALLWENISGIVINLSASNHRIVTARISIPPISKVSLRALITLSSWYEDFSSDALCGGFPSGAARIFILRSPALGWPTPCGSSCYALANECHAPSLGPFRSVPFCSRAGSPRRGDEYR